MKLTFRRKHLSISELAETDLPDFTVLTGVNGSGKSHLLDAIEQKHLAIDGQDQHRIVKFNFETFKLENEGAYNAVQLSAERDGAWQMFDTQLRPQLEQHRTSLGAQYDAVVATIDKKGALWERSESFLQPYKQNVSGFLKAPQYRGNNQVQAIYSLAQRLPYGIDQITQERFKQLYQPFEMVRDFLPHALGKIIWDYYVKYRQNQVNEFLNEKHGKNYPVQTEADFIATHGEKPWDVLNSILRQFNSIDYAVSSPESLEHIDTFTLRLVHTRKENLKIEFSNLSSGERVLMALVASVYKASADRNFPDVLLLDELDASLHPSMIKNMLAVIESVFLSKGIKIILVTHSPSTVALAPEDSIFIMQKDGPARLRKAGKREALSILTEGFATLDDGMIIFDEVAINPLSIITEGHNTRLIAEALRHQCLGNVKIINGLEGISGKTQLKTLFDFFSRIDHKNKVLFVWDCDMAGNLTAANSTVPFVLPRNTTNTLVQSGIENCFPETLFDGFKKSFTDSHGVTKVSFDEQRKKDFGEFVVQRNQAMDFVYFAPLIARIRELLK